MGFSRKKVLVTGGKGFLGSHVCRELLNCGAEVVLLDYNLERNIGRIQDIYNDLQVFEGDILDYELVEKAASGVDAVVHAAFPAAHCKRTPEKQFIAVGTEGTFNTLKAAWKKNAVFIYISSISVYGYQKYLPIDEEHPVEPFLLYGVTKLAGEYYCRVMSEEFGAKTVILRLSDLYGPDSGRICAPNIFLENAYEGKPIIINGGGHQMRTYLYISDAVQSVLHAIENGGGPGEVFNVGGPDCISIKELAGRVKKIVPAEALVNFEPGAPDPRCYSISSQRAEKYLGYVPRVNINQGLQKTFDWIKNIRGERFA